MVNISRTEKVTRSKVFKSNRDVNQEISGLPENIKKFLLGKVQGGEKENNKQLVEKLRNKSKSQSYLRCFKSRLSAKKASENPCNMQQLKDLKNKLSLKRLELKTPKNKEKNETNIKSLKKSSKVHEKLFKEHIEISQRKFGALKEKVRREMSEEKKICKFRPTLLKSSKEYIKIKNKEIEKKRTKPKRRDENLIENKTYYFTPEINEFSSENPNWQLYTSRNIFDRLYEVKKKDKKYRKQTFESLNNKERTKESFNNFIDRQNQLLLRKEENINNFLKSEKIFFSDAVLSRPKKSQNKTYNSVFESLVIPRQKLKSEFQRELKEFVRRKSLKPIGKTCFVSVKNKWEKRKERIIKLKEEENSKELTFSPKINIVKKKVTSRFHDPRKKEDPEELSKSNFLRLKKESEDCTFYPKTISLPHFYYYLGKR